MNDESKKHALTSIILAVVPYLLFAYVYICSLFSVGHRIGGAFLFVLYYMTIGIPVYIASLYYVYKSLKLKMNAIAIVSLVLNLILLIVLVLVAVGEEVVHLLR